IRTEVNIATIPVVVRDSSGRPVGDLQRENFQLFDNGKMQEITHFTVEQTIEKTTAGGRPNYSHAGIIAPIRFTAMLLDCTQPMTDTLPQVRDASLHRLAMNPDPSERIGIFTTSGALTVDFTDNMQALRDAVDRLKWNPPPNATMHDCPNISHHQANL